MGKNEFDDNASKVDYNHDDARSDIRDIPRQYIAGLKRRDFHKKQLR